MRWTLHDFLEGHSDPEHLQVASRFGAVLFSHPTLHLKLWSIDRTSVEAGTRFHAAVTVRNGRAKVPGHESRPWTASTKIVTPPDGRGPVPAAADSAPSEAASSTAARARIGVARSGGMAR